MVLFYVLFENNAKYFEGFVDNNLPVAGVLGSADTCNKRACKVAKSNKI